MTTGNNLITVLSLVAAAASTGCAPPPLPNPGDAGTATFKSDAWGIRLEYPADWKATPGEANAPLVVDIRAPGRADVIGAGVSVVGAYSAAPLAEVGAGYFEEMEGPIPAAEKATVSGCPALVYLYGRGSGKDAVTTRLVVVRAPERYFIITFAAYQPQLETTLSYFDRIEKSITID